MAEYRVVVPETDLVVVKFVQEKLPGVAVINRALEKFEPKQVFAWHLSILIQLENLVEQGMPSPSEQRVVEEFEEELGAGDALGNARKPNALFLARVTWNATRELVYRVYDPEPVAKYLGKIIAGKAHPREFDFRIDQDAPWQKATWHLSAFQSRH